MSLLNQQHVFFVRASMPPDGDGQSTPPHRRHTVPSSYHHDGTRYSTIMTILYDQWYCTIRWYYARGCQMAAPRTSVLSGHALLARLVRNCNCSRARCTRRHIAAAGRAPGAAAPLQEGGGQGGGGQHTGCRAVPTQGRARRACAARARRAAARRGRGAALAVARCARPFFFRRGASESAEVNCERAGAGRAARRGRVRGGAQARRRRRVRGRPPGGARHGRSPRRVPTRTQFIQKSGELIPRAGPLPCRRGGDAARAATRLGEGGRQARRWRAVRSLPQLWRRPSVRWPLLQTKHPLPRIGMLRRRPTTRRRKRFFSPSP